MVKLTCFGISCLIEEPFFVHFIVKCSYEVFRIPTQNVGTKKLNERLEFFSFNFLFFHTQARMQTQERQISLIAHAFFNELHSFQVYHHSFWNQAKKAKIYIWFVNIVLGIYLYIAFTITYICIYSHLKASICIHIFTVHEY